MNWRDLLQLGAQAPEADEPETPVSAASVFRDPYAEKRRRAVEMLGEHYVLHPAKTVQRLPVPRGTVGAMRFFRRQDP